MSTPGSFNDQSGYTKDSIKSLLNSLSTHAKAVREEYGADDGPAFFALHPLIRSGVRPLCLPAFIEEDPDGDEEVKKMSENGDWTRAESALKDIGYDSHKTDIAVESLRKINKAEKTCTKDHDEVKKGQSHLKVRETLDDQDVHNIVHAVTAYGNFCMKDKNLPKKFKADITAICFYVREKFTPKAAPEAAPREKRKLH